MSTTIKMNPAIKAEWVALLRSGIPQLKGYLAKPDGSRCCLGVLCDMAVKQGLLEVLDPNDDGYLSYVNFGDSFDEGCEAEDTGLLRSVVGWAGLYDSSADIDHPEYGTISLAALNDGSTTHSKSGDGLDPIVVPAHTFAQIADLIEEHL